MAHPVLAGLLRAAVFVVPIGTSAFAAWAVRPLLPHVTSTSTRAWETAALLAVALVTALATERVARRALPLAALLKLTMLFPDRAPSRFAVARKANAVRVLEQRLDSADQTTAGAAETILALLTALSRHDSRTRGHAERVRVYADLLGEQLGLSERDRDLLRWAALLHDIGKLQVAARLLNKPGRPTVGEWEQLRAHPEAGIRLAAPLLPWLGEWSDAILDHHERWDGTGYPRGLAAERISLAGRAVAVVDAYEVMTSARTYKRAVSTRAARAELTRCAGSHFDAAIVRAFLEISLPRLLWASGWLSFLAQLPMMSQLRQVATTVGAQPIAVAQSVAVAGVGIVGGTSVPPQPPAPAPAIVHVAATPAPTASPRVSATAAHRGTAPRPATSSPHPAPTATHSAQPSPSSTHLTPTASPHLAPPSTATPPSHTGQPPSPPAGHPTHIGQTNPTHTTRAPAPPTGAATRTTSAAPHTTGAGSAAPLTTGSHAQPSHHNAKP